MSESLSIHAGMQWIAAAKADGGPKRFSMEAYSGGTIRQPWSPDPIVIDLAGMQFKQVLPVVVDHTYQFECVLGQTSAVRADAGALLIDGELLAATEVAVTIAQLASAGYECQASVGCDVHAVQRVAQGDSVTVNGRTFQGPVRVVTSSTLREVSFVVLGADAETRVRVAAKLPQEMSMADESYSPPADAPTGPTGQAGVENPPNQETPMSQSARGPVDIHGDRIVAALDRLEQRLAKVETSHGADGVRASRPSSPPVGGAAFGAEPKVIEAALAMQAGLKSLEQSYDERTLEAAHAKRRDVSLSDVFVQAARANGYDGTSKVSDSSLPVIIRAAFASHQIADLLSNLANKFLLNGFNAVDSAWQRIAAVRSVNDFKVINLLRLNGDLKFQKVGPAGELKTANVSDYKRTVAAETFGVTSQVTRADLFNDDLSALTLLPQRMGRGAALALNEAIWTEFLASNSTYFAKASPGAGNALSIASLEAAAVAYRQLKDPDGNPLGISPRFLIVPPTLEVAAAKLMSSNLLIASGLASTSSKTIEPAQNVLAGRYEVITSPYLETVTGNSTSTWWLTADGADLPALDVVFLNGQQTPTIEQVMPDADKLGVTLRGFHDFGVTKGEPLSCYRMATA